MHLVEPRGSPRGPWFTSWNLVAHLVDPGSPRSSWRTPGWNRVVFVVPPGCSLVPATWWFSHQPGLERPRLFFESPLGCTWLPAIWGFRIPGLEQPSYFRIVARMHLVPATWGFSNSTRLGTPGNFPNRHAPGSGYLVVSNQPSLERPGYFSNRHAGGTRLRLPRDIRINSGLETTGDFRIACTGQLF